MKRVRQAMSAQLLFGKRNVRLTVNKNENAR